MIDYAAQTYTLFVNGVAQTNGSASTTLGFRDTTNLGDSIRFSNGTTGGANTQTYLLDNLSLTIPEPGSFALLSLGCLAIFGRRRNLNKLKLDIAGVA